MEISLAPPPRRKDKSRDGRGGEEKEAKEEYQEEGEKVFFWALGLKREIRGLLRAPKLIPSKISSRHKNSLMTAGKLVHCACACKEGRANQEGDRPPNHHSDTLGSLSIFWRLNRHRM